MRVSILSGVSLLIILGVALLTSCRIQINVPEGGKVVTRSGDHVCESGERCTIGVYDLFFDQEFIAEPASGYTFAEWKKVDRGLCAHKSSPCRIVSAWAQIHEIFMQLLESDDVFYLEPVFANTWNKVGKELPGEAGGDLSGTSISISANGYRFAAGAPGNTDDVNDIYDIGQVRVYEWLGNEWLQLGADIDGKAEGDRLGSSVDISDRGDRLAVGATGVDDNGDSAGQVKTYSWSGSEWLQLGQVIDGEAAFDYAGTAVSLSGDGNRMAVGARGSSGGGYRSGQVRVFEWNGASWQQLGSDIDGAVPGELSGYAVSLSRRGDYLAVGAIDNGSSADSSGAARVYAWTDDAWQQVGADIQGKNPYDWFGISVSLSASGSQLAIGSGQGNYAQVYQWTEGQWRQQGDDLSGASDGKFGNSVSLSADGNRLAIGDPWRDDNGYNAGQVKVYSWSGTVWTQLLQNINGYEKRDNFGVATAISDHGNRVAAGAYLGGGNSRGYAAVYEMTYDEAPEPPVDPMKVYLLKPAHTEVLSQNNPATGCTYHPQAGYGLRIDFDWSDAQSTAGIRGYHLYAIGRNATAPMVDTFTFGSEYTHISCGSYVINPYASSGFTWSVQAEDNEGNLGPLNDEGYFVFELCYLENGQPCG